MRFVLSPLLLIAGFVNLLPVPEGGSTLAIVPRSHLFHKELLENMQRQERDCSEDFVKMEERDMDLARDLISSSYPDESGLPIKVDRLDPGDMVLWDSRAIHWGANADPGSCDPETGIYAKRMVVYVCQTPRRWCSPKVLEARRQALLHFKTTSHWPHKVTVFPDAPRHYGRPEEVMGGLYAPGGPHPIMACAPKTELGARLCGFSSLREMNDALASKYPQ